MVQFLSVERKRWASWESMWVAARPRLPSSIELLSPSPSPPCEMELWFQCRVTRSHAQVCMKQKGMFLSLFDKDGNSSPHKDEKMTSFRSCVLFLLLFFLSNNNPNCRLLVFFVSLLFFSPFFPLPFSLSKNVTLYTSVCVVVIVICFRFHVEKAQKRKLHYSL